MIFYDALTHILDRPGYEQDVRAHMALASINHEQYPYLVPKPHPEPEYLRQWFEQQFGHAPDSYLMWKGWILLQDHTDAVSVMLTWFN